MSGTARLIVSRNLISRKYATLDELKDGGRVKPPKAKFKVYEKNNWAADLDESWSLPGILKRCQIQQLFENEEGIEKAMKDEMEELERTFGYLEKIKGKEITQVYMRDFVTDPKRQANILKWLQSQSTKPFDEAKEREKLAQLVRLILRHKNQQRHARVLRPILPATTVRLQNEGNQRVCRNGRQAVVLPRYGREFGGYCWEEDRENDEREIERQRQEGEPERRSE